MATAKATSSDFVKFLQNSGKVDGVKLAHVSSRGKAEFRVLLPGSVRAKKARSYFTDLFWSFWTRDECYWCEIDAVYKDGPVIPRKTA